MSGFSQRMKGLENYKKLTIFILESWEQSFAYTRRFLHNYTTKVFVAYGHWTLVHMGPDTRGAWIRSFWHFVGRTDGRTDGFDRSFACLNISSWLYWIPMYTYTHRCSPQDCWGSLLWLTSPPPFETSKILTNWKKKKKPPKPQLCSGCGHYRQVYFWNV